MLTVTLLPLIVAVPESEQGTRALEREMDDLIDIIQDHLPEGVEFLAPEDERYVGAVVQAAMGVMQAMTPEVVATADAMMRTLGVRPPGETLN